MGTHFRGSVWSPYSVASRVLITSTSSERAASTLRNFPCMLRAFQHRIRKRKTVSIYEKLHVGTCRFPGSHDFLVRLARQHPPKRLMRGLLRVSYPRVGYPLFCRNISCPLWAHLETFHRNSTGAYLLPHSNIQMEDRVTRSSTTQGTPRLVPMIALLMWGTRNRIQVRVPSWIRPAIATPAELLSQCTEPPALKEG